MASCGCAACSHLRMLLVSHQNLFGQEACPQAEVILAPHLQGGSGAPLELVASYARVGRHCILRQLHTVLLEVNRCASLPMPLPCSLPAGPAQPNRQLEGILRRQQHGWVAGQRYAARLPVDGRAVHWHQRVCYHTATVSSMMRHACDLLGLSGVMHCATRGCSCLRLWPAGW